MQRLSNNFRPQFTDEEAMTACLWGILQRRFEVAAIYQYTKMPLLEWLAKSPGYQAFDTKTKSAFVTDDTFSQYFDDSCAQIQMLKHCLLPELADGGSLVYTKS